MDTISRQVIQALRDLAEVVPQAEIARRSDIDPAVISKLLSGERQYVSGPAMDRLGKLLRVEVRPHWVEASRWWLQQASE